MVFLGSRIVCRFFCVFVYPACPVAPADGTGVGPEDRTGAPLHETFSVPHISLTEDGISVALRPVYPGQEKGKIMRVVDLRSDTITRPTPAMRRAMADAEVGDDVFGEDPTVNRLEEMAAERLNKEAALFVASGTMANLVSLLVHCGRGDEVILGDRSHTFFYEQGGCAGLGGIHPRTLPNKPDGTLGLRAIEEAIRPDNIHFPRTRLIVLENTHNRCSGSPLSPGYMEGVGEIARRNRVKVHVDGARIFNAAISLDRKSVV